MEKILNIVDTTFEVPNQYGKFDGYIVLTDKQEIKLGISNGQSCCENWGYFMSEDNLDEFIGADLLDINITDAQLDHVEPVSVYERDVMFVTLKTTKGVLQFVAYNEHNGYYGHEAIVVSEQITHSENL